MLWLRVNTVFLPFKQLLRCQLGSRTHVKVSAIGAYDLETADSLAKLIDKLLVLSFLLDFTRVECQAAAERRTQGNA